MKGEAILSNVGVVRCQFCGEFIERFKSNKKFTCFKCKEKRKKKYSHKKK